MISGKRLVLGSLLIVAGGAILASAPATAQQPPPLQGPVPGAQGQPGVRPDRPDTRTTPAIAAENYNPKGVEVGSFRLYPDLELDEIYNDNIYAVPTSVGKQGAFIQGIKPSFDLRSDWNVHMLNVYTKAGFGLYSVDGALNNYQDVSAGADGRFDIQRDWNIYGGGSWNRRHEERGSPNTVTTSTLPITVYN
jgi:hypothetical protein